MLREDNDSKGGKPGDGTFTVQIMLALSWFVRSKCLPSPTAECPSAVLTAFFCCFFLTHLYVCQGRIIPPERWWMGESRETEMKDDECLIKVERWMTPYVMTASSGQSEQNKRGFATLHINRRTPDSQMPTLIFPLGFVLHQTWNLITTGVFQVMKSVFGSFCFAGKLRHQRVSQYSFIISSRLCSYIHQYGFHHTSSA